MRLKLRIGNPGHGSVSRSISVPSQSGARPHRGVRIAAVLAEQVGDIGDARGRSPLTGLAAAILGIVHP